MSDDEVRDRLLLLELGWATHHGWPRPAMVLAGVIDEFDDAGDAGAEPAGATPEPPS